MKKNKMKKEIVKCLSGFSRRVLEERTILVGIWIAIYWPVSNLQLVLKP